MTFQRQDIAKLWPREKMLSSAFALEGEVFRDVPGRRTLKVQLGGKNYFVKLHYGVGWLEICKNWLQFKRPVISAENEFVACSQLVELGLRAPIPAAFGQTSGSIARRQSFVLCDELAGFTSLEDVVATWPTSPPKPLVRLRLLYAIADFARKFHGFGFIHRDFYICHLLADNAALAQSRIELAVLDLHRARRFDSISDRWLKRELAALLFSSLVIPLTKTEQLRFLRRYTGRPLRSELADRASFWSAVVARSQKLDAQEQRRQTAGTS